MLGRYATRYIENISMALKHAAGFSDSVMCEERWLVTYARCRALRAFAEKIQGEWHNPEDGEISVADTKVTFLRNGGKLSFDLFQEADLHEPWQECRSRKNGAVYYWNPRTNESTWETFTVQSLPLRSAEKYSQTRTTGAYYHKDDKSVEGEQLSDIIRIGGFGLSYGQLRLVQVTDGDTRITWGAADHRDLCDQRDKIVTLMASVRNDARCDMDYKLTKLTQQLASLEAKIEGSTVTWTKSTKGGRLIRRLLERTPPEL